MSVAQLPLFRPRVSLRGQSGTVIDDLGPGGHYDTIVRFDGPHTYATDGAHTSLAGCMLLVRLADCKAVS